MDDLRRIWEKRLLKDIIATMIEVLPGRSCDELTGQDIQARTEIIDEARCASSSTRSSVGHGNQGYGHSGCRDE